MKALDSLGILRLHQVRLVRGSWNHGACHGGRATELTSTRDKTARLSHTGLSHLIRSNSSFIHLDGIKKGGQREETPASETLRGSLQKPGQSYLYALHLAFSDMAAAIASANKRIA